MESDACSAALRISFKLKLLFRERAQHRPQGDPRTAVESDRLQRRHVDLILTKTIFRERAQHRPQGDPRSAVESNRLQRRPATSIRTRLQPAGHSALRRRRRSRCL